MDDFQFTIDDFLRLLQPRVAASAYAVHSRVMKLSNLDARANQGFGLRNAGGGSLSI